MTYDNPPASSLHHSTWGEASNNNKDSFLITSNLIFRREKRSGGEWQTNVSVKLFGKLSFGLSATASYDSSLESATENHVLKQSMQDSFDSLVSLVIGWSYYFLLSEQISFFTALCWMKVSCLKSYEGRGMVSMVTLKFKELYLIMNGVWYVITVGELFLGGTNELFITLNFCSQKLLYLLD